MSNSLGPYGLSVHGILQARIQSGFHALFRGIFSTQGLNPSLLCLLPWQAGSLPLALPGKPRVVRPRWTQQYDSGTHIILPVHTFKKFSDTKFEQDLKFLKNLKSEKKNLKSAKRNYKWIAFHLKVSVEQRIKLQRKVTDLTMEFLTSFIKETHTVKVKITPKYTI